MYKVKMKEFEKFLSEFLFPTLEEFYTIDRDDWCGGKHWTVEEDVRLHMPDISQNEWQYEFEAVVNDVKLMKNTGVVLSIDTDQEDDEFRGYFNALTGSDNDEEYVLFVALFTTMHQTFCRYLDWVDETGDWVGATLDERDEAAMLSYKWMPIVWDYFTARDVMEYMGVEED